MLKDSGRCPKSPQRPLPDALRDRLRSIPQRVVLCRDVERLYAASKERAASRPPEPAVAEHLATCDRCQAIYGALESTFAEPVPPPSADFLGQLRGIGRPANREGEPARQVALDRGDPKRRASLLTTHRFTNDRAASGRAASGRAASGRAASGRAASGRAASGRKARPVQPLPDWVVDSRFTAAACLALTVFLAGLAGEAQALLREAPLLREAQAAVQSTASTWAAAGEARGRNVFETVNATVWAGYRDGRSALEETLASSKTLLRTAIDDLASRFDPSVTQWADPEPAPEGETDEPSEPIR